MAPGTYPLWEGANLVVSGTGARYVEVYDDARPDSTRVRDAIRARWGYAMTLGAWVSHGSYWRCPVLTAIMAKR